MTSPRMQVAYDAYFRAAHDVARIALFETAEAVREDFPDAVAMRINWSDQGDYLEPCATPVFADGREDDPIDAEDMCALDDDNRDTWKVYAEDGDARRHREATGYVFPLDKILTDLAPTP